MKEHRDEQNDEKRGQRGTETRADSSFEFPQFVAYEDADIDGEDPRTALCNGDKVDKLLFVEPLVAVYHFAFNNRYHSVSAAKGECANLEKGFKTLPIDIVHCFRFML